MADPIRAFGSDRFFANAPPHAERCPTPVGEECVLCGMPIADGDDGVLWPYFSGPAPEGLDPTLPSGEGPVHAFCFVDATLRHLRHA